MNRNHIPFDDVAADYDAWFESAQGKVIFGLEVACLRRLIPFPARRWVEVGVGTGRFAEALGVPHGIDPSAAMLEFATQRKIQTWQGIGEILPYADKYFEGVLITTTLCFLSDPKKTLEECYRVLVDAGRLVVGMIPVATPWSNLYYRKATEGHPIYAAAHFYFCDEVIGIAESAGFNFRQAFSCLLDPPGSHTLDAPPHVGIVKDAGFVALGFDKTR